MNAFRIEPLTGLRVLRDGLRSVRHELFGPMARRFFGRQYGFVAPLALISFGAFSWPAIGFLLWPFVPRLGLPTPMVLPLQVLLMLVVPQILFAFLIGFILRKFLWSPFVRGDLRMTQLSADDLLRLLVGMLALAFAAFYATQDLSLGLRYAIEDKDYPRDVRILFATFPWAYDRRIQHPSELWVVVRGLWLAIENLAGLVATGFGVVFTLACARNGVIGAAGGILIAGGYAALRVLQVAILVHMQRGGFRHPNAPEPEMFAAELVVGGVILCGSVLIGGLYLRLVQRWFFPPLFHEPETRRT